MTSCSRAACDRYFGGLVSLAAAIVLFSGSPSLARDAAPPAPAEQVKPATAQAGDGADEEAGEQGADQASGDQVADTPGQTETPPVAAAPNPDDAGTDDAAADDGKTGETATATDTDTHPDEEPAGAEGVEQKAEATKGALPHDLSPWGMFESADWIVKGVMIGLVLASVLTWTVTVRKTVQFGRLKKAIQRDIALFDAHKEFVSLTWNTDIAAAIVNAVSAELHVSADLTEKEGIKERTTSRLLRVEAAAARGMANGTGLLATVGSTAPFVGLFGTVWGIMNSFIGIAETQTTNLAVVAPGIAEALLATAFGLVAAIPAVVMYNHFARRIAAMKALVTDFSAGALRHVSRELDQGGVSGFKSLQAAE
jgi:biopolymer transport protein ExbB